VCHGSHPFHHTVPSMMIIIIMSQHGIHCSLSSSNPHCSSLSLTIIIHDAAAAGSCWLLLLLSSPTTCWQGGKNDEIDIRCTNTSMPLILILVLLVYHIFYFYSTSDKPCRYLAGVIITVDKIYRISVRVSCF